MSYWLIKTLLVLSLIVVTVVLLRPVKTDSSLALRRIGMLLVLLAAAFAIIFPEIFNKFARAIGVQTGLNLVVYLLVVAIFAQMATSYRREATTEVKLTQMAREMALLQTELNMQVDKYTEECESRAEAVGSEGDRDAGTGPVAAEGSEGGKAAGDRGQAGGREGTAPTSGDRTQPGELEETVAKPSGMAGERHAPLTQKNRADQV